MVFLDKIIFQQILINFRASYSLLILKLLILMIEGLLKNFKGFSEHDLGIESSFCITTCSLTKSFT